jgi:hypothetical protein
MEPQITEWALKLARERQEVRDWNLVPHDLQYAAVRHVYELIRPHFGKQDISARIEASRAQTFYDLRAAILKASVPARSTG